MIPLPAEPNDTTRIAVIGLGYVGLPLAVEFGRLFDTIGFDEKAERVAALENGEDSTHEVSTAELAAARRLTLTADRRALSGCDVYILCVPTPVDSNNRPDLEPLQRASVTVGQTISEGGLVIVESTVFPGATEDVVAAAVAEHSGLELNVSFFAGYSPERINPADPKRRLALITKVTSGSTPEAARFVDALYATIVQAGTHPAPSIRVAEAAKVIENTQRDLNIALINELALIFDRLGVDTPDVLAAARTKWNFLDFRPGLVGGHCIGVDPYYLTYKAQEVGYHSELILAGRRINDSMPTEVAHRVIRLMTQRHIALFEARILVLGYAFKENCPDTRNTKVEDLVRTLLAYEIDVEVFDPHVDLADCPDDIDFVTTPRAPYDAIVAAVAHDEFRTIDEAQVRAWSTPNAVVFDLKELLPADIVTARL